MTLRARGRATVPTDGRPHRFELSRFETAAKTEVVATAELAEAAIWRCVGTNEGEGPILAGPVELQKGCGLVGRTTTLHVAPGESFPLGFGPEGHLRREIAVPPLETETVKLRYVVKKRGEVHGL